MKLYTEEEIRKAIAMGFDWCHQKHIPSDDMIIRFIQSLKTIELPSEGDIIEASHTEIYQVTFNPFASGALWMRDKIQGGMK